MTPEAVAFWIRAPGVGELRRATLPVPGDDEVLVRALRSGISRGTEALVFRGQVPPDQYARMRAPFQEGDFPGPVKYGYLNVGVVEQGPGDLEGRTVFCLYPHQSRYVVPASAVVPVPDGVPPERAVLAGTVETAVNALWDARALLDDADVEVPVLHRSREVALLEWRPHPGVLVRGDLAAEHESLGPAADARPEGAHEDLVVARNGNGRSPQLPDAGSPDPERDRLRRHA